MEMEKEVISFQLSVINKKQNSGVRSKASGRLSVVNFSLATSHCSLFTAFILTPAS